MVGLHLQHVQFWEISIQPHGGLLQIPKGTGSLDKTNRNLTCKPLKALRGQQENLVRGGEVRTV